MKVVSSSFWSLFSSFISIVPCSPISIKLSLACISWICEHSYSMLWEVFHPLLMFFSSFSFFWCSVMVLSIINEIVLSFDKKKLSVFLACLIGLRIYLNG